MKESNPYNKMFEDRIIFLGVQVDDASANDVMAQLLTLESHRPGPRHHHVHQLARWLVHRDDGDLRHDAVRPAGHQTVCLGQAASAAAVLLAGRHAGQADGAAATRGSSSTSRPPRAATGRARTSRSRPARSCGCAPSSRRCSSRHSGQPIEKVRKDIDRDKILTAEEAKEYGLVDTVLASRKKSLQSARRRQLTRAVSGAGRHA